MIISLFKWSLATTDPESPKNETRAFVRCDKEYEELISTLQKLSSEHKLEIMVPLSKKAFLPGQVCFFSSSPKWVNVLTSNNSYTYLCGHPVCAEIRISPGF